MNNVMSLRWSKLHVLMVTTCTTTPAGSTSGAAGAAMAKIEGGPHSFFLFTTTPPPECLFHQIWATSNPIFSFLYTFLQTISKQISSNY